MESTFMERKNPGGVKNTSAPGQYRMKFGTCF
jgi:hypothetical protein